MMFRAGLFGLAFAVVAAWPLSAQDTGFPVTVEHALGTVTIPAEPQRVVALIDRDADTLLALGVQPVGIRSNFGFENGVGPWAEHLLSGNPDIWLGRELNYEAIAAAEPDFIVFAFSGGDQAEYDRLTQIAPVIALPKDAAPWEATTQQTTLLIAEALGRRADGERLINELDAYLSTQHVAHPEFTGKSANYLDIFPGGIASYSDRHIINGTLYSLGFSPIPGAVEVPEGEAQVDVSAEMLPDYLGDVTLVFPYGRTLDELVAENPILGTAPQAETGGIVILDNLAFSTASVLSIPYALDQLVPQFAETVQP